MGSKMNSKNFGKRLVHFIKSLNNLVKHWFKSIKDTNS